MCDCCSSSKPPPVKEAPKPLPTAPAPKAKPVPVEVKGLHPYLRFGGEFKGDKKDIDEYKFVTFKEIPKYTPSHKSLLVKHLTVDLFEQLKSEKTTKDFSFSNVIQPGTVTPNLLIGAVAGDEECYTKFRDLYRPIIKDWHGYEIDYNVQPWDTDYGHVYLTAEQEELFAGHVKATRFQGSRNLTGHSFPAGSGHEERVKVEEKLKAAFLKFEGDLKGSYTELEKYEKKRLEELQAKGHVFPTPNDETVVKPSGAGRQWPKNRGVFICEKEGAFVWVNEEDHCRIIASKAGFDVVSTFRTYSELSRVLSENLDVDFAWDDALGYLGPCPGNLGTGLKSSLHVHLPHFTRLLDDVNFPEHDRDLIYQVCSTFGLQAHGHLGEHTKVASALWDISLMARMGITEAQGVMQLVENVTKVIKFEKLLAEGIAPEAIRVLMLESETGCCAGGGRKASHGCTCVIPSCTFVCCDSALCGCPACEVHPTCLLCGCGHCCSKKCQQESCQCVSSCSIA